MSRAWIIVAAEKEELASELRLRVHLHEPRRERIERDVYRVRMGTSLCFALWRSDTVPVAVAQPRTRWDAPWVTAAAARRWPLPLPSSAELKLHNERLVRHCAGVVQALHKEKESFFKLREDQNSISSAFQQRIHDMENVFLMASRAEK